MHYQRIEPLPGTGGRIRAAIRKHENNRDRFSVAIGEQWQEENELIAETIEKLDQAGYYELATEWERIQILRDRIAKVTVKMAMIDVELIKAMVLELAEVDFHDAEEGND